MEAVFPPEGPLQAYVTPGVEDDPVRVTLLAVQESYFRGLQDGTPAKILDRIKEHYYEIKAGIGWYKSPDVYGAFPTDAYSHTPANAGAKQPGLTGQVKEDILCRFGELGVFVDEGELYFDPCLLRKE